MSGRVAQAYVSGELDIADDIAGRAHLHTRSCDACAWWGIWLIAAGTWPGALTVLSPVVMTYFLVFATGARLLERSMAQRPEYTEYQRRTSYFFPLPPDGRP